MSQVASNPRQAQPTTPSAASARPGSKAVRPFAGLIDAVLVEQPASITFAGCVSREPAQAVWTWLVRDVCPDLITPEMSTDGSLDAAKIEPLMPQVLTRMRDTLARTGSDPEAGRRLRVALGHEDAHDAVPKILLALRSRALLVKAQAFGRAVNTIPDDAALGVALQSMPLQDPPLAALLFHATIGQVSNPTRLVTSVIKLAGNATEVTIARSGFGPLVDAVLAHAQNQIHLMQSSGAFADIDLICRALDRFHRLVRALTGYVEFARGSQWSGHISAITKQVSDRIEPRLKNVVPDINLALRRGREGSDRVDNDGLLAALNGVYLLSAVRDCRASLAINALFDQAWTQSAQALELHIQRNLDLIRENPSDKAVAARLDAGIKMAEIRFNAEYAETLRRARLAAERRN